MMMKKYSFTLALVVLCNLLFAQEKCAIHFLNETAWDHAVALATKSGKMLFVYGHSLG